VRFRPDLLLSRNWFDLKRALGGGGGGGASGSFRRLKNVVVVMEVVPDRSKLSTGSTATAAAAAAAAAGEGAGERAALSEVDERRLRRVFQAFDKVRYG
jgi:hypothetical protein